MYGFKFEIGSFVKLIGQAELRPTKEAWTVQPVKDKRGHVISRLLEECSGGVQRMYMVRWQAGDGYCCLDLSRVHEIELVASEPFPANDPDHRAGEKEQPTMTIKDSEGGSCAEFGRMAFEYVKECISEGCFEHEVETLAELAVKAGLMVCEPYDPAKHNIKFTHYDYEPGDMIYYWGKPSA